jgi:hypothetical protein
MFAVAYTRRSNMNALDYIFSVDWRCASYRIDLFESQMSKFPIRSEGKKNVRIPNLRFTIQFYNLDYILTSLGTKSKHFGQRWKSLLKMFYEYT